MPSSIPALLFGRTPGANAVAVLVSGLFLHEAPSSYSGQPNRPAELLTGAPYFCGARSSHLRQWRAFSVLIKISLMKIEVFILPKDGDVRTASPAPPVAPAGNARQMSALKIPWKLMALSLLLVGIFTMCGMAGYSAYSAIAAMDELTVRHPSAAASQKQKASASTRAADEKSRVHLFDNSQLLRRGDVVVVRQKSGSNVGEVAVAANSAGVVRRNGHVEALYLLGENRYVVTAQGRTQVVRGTDIFATVGSGSDATR